LRVLFIGEGCTLAHAARPLALAAALPKDRFDATVAVPERYGQWAAGHLKVLSLDAQTPETFARRLAAGRPLFSLPRLERYVAQDLDLIAQVRPQAVVGDFRLSLAVSARKAGAPYINISNAYWSPDLALRPTRPTLDVFHGWPQPLAKAVFRMFLPSALRWHARPMDRLLSAHGLPGIGGDLRRAFTEADLTLFADPPALFPTLADGDRRRFLGPVAWEPPIDPPAWWTQIPDDVPTAYLTLGSSGSAEAIERAAGWLAQAGYTTMVSTAGRSALQGDGRRLFVADYLPGSAACQWADLVVCNGGSPTVNQAISAGKPVLGLCSNLDQFLNMQAVQAQGSGLLLRADDLSQHRFASALGRLRGSDFTAAAAALAESVRSIDPAAILAEAIERLAA
jgi:UDP:flavonoid glycosyltransferase YjiC (YdhE family)